MQFVKALYWIFYIHLCFERVIRDFGGVAKKCDGFAFILAGLLVQWRGFKSFSGSLKSCQKVEREFGGPWFGGCATQGCHCGSISTNVL